MRKGGAVRECQQSSARNAAATVAICSGVESARTAASVIFANRSRRIWRCPAAAGARLGATQEVSCALAMPANCSRTRPQRGATYRPRARYLLSGLLVCEHCGGRFIATGKHGSHYTCSTHTQGGEAACPVSICISRPVAESLVLKPIRRELLGEEASTVNHRVAAPVAEPGIIRDHARSVR
jgi:hypothetical protein